MNFLRKKRWSPYLGGVILGLLNLFAIYCCHHALGASSAFTRYVGMIEKWLAPKHFATLKYYHIYKPFWNFTAIAVIGMFIGGYLSARLSNDIKIRLIPKMWGKRFGNSGILRIIVSIIGGICIGFGARMAGGCTSGQGISGGSFLSVSGWLAICCFFIGGIITAFILFGTKDY